MRRAFTVVLGLLLCIVLLTAGGIYYFRYVSYPADKDGMIGTISESESGEEVSEMVEISLDENPTTGYVWEYEISPTGILETAGDKYVTDRSEEEGGMPLVGVGGTHYWWFRVIGNGEADIRFVCKRGNETLYGSEITYTYRCDGEKAVLIEEQREIPGQMYSLSNNS